MEVTVFGAPVQCGTHYYGATFGVVGVGSSGCAGFAQGKLFHVQMNIIPPEGVNQMEGLLGFILIEGLRIHLP